MKNEQRYLQIRMTAATRKEIAEIALRLNLTAADVIRGALHFGLPVFAALNDAQTELGRRLARLLKKESRSIKSDEHDT
jgi:hypothetical protein